MNKGKELQLRRQFFKKAVKGTLLILVAIVFTTIPRVLSTDDYSLMECHGCYSTYKEPIGIHDDSVATQHVELNAYKLMEQLVKVKDMVNKQLLIDTGIILT